MTIQRENRPIPSEADPRAALEALFAPRQEPPPPSLQRLGDGGGRSEPGLRSAYAVTRVTKLLFAAGFTLPIDQEIQRKVLEHSDEAQVRDALCVLMALLEREPPQRPTVLDARLRRLEENAEERATRDLAAALRRRVTMAVRRY